MHCLLKVVTKNGRGALESQWRIYRGISQRSALVGKRVSIRVAGHQEQRQTHKGTPPKKMFSFGHLPVWEFKNLARTVWGTYQLMSHQGKKANLPFMGNGKKGPEGKCPIVSV